MLIRGDNVILYIITSDNDEAKVYLKKAQYKSEIVYHSNIKPSEQIDRLRNIFEEEYCDGKYNNAYLIIDMGLYSQRLFSKPAKINILDKSFPYIMLEEYHNNNKEINMVTYRSSVEQDGFENMFMYNIDAVKFFCDCINERINSNFVIYPGVVRSEKISVTNTYNILNSNNKLRSIIVEPSKMSLVD